MDGIIDNSNSSEQSGFVELYDDCILIEAGEIEISKEEYESLEPETQSDFVLVGEYAYYCVQCIQFCFSPGQIAELLEASLEIA